MGAFTRRDYVEVAAEVKAIGDAEVRRKVALIFVGVFGRRGEFRRRKFLDACGVEVS